MLVMLFIIEDIIDEKTYFLKARILSSSNSKLKMTSSNEDMDDEIQKITAAVTDSLSTNPICLTRKRLAVINHYKNKGWRIIDIHTEKTSDFGAETQVYMESTSIDPEPNE